MLDSVRNNLVSPLTLSFGLGVLAKVIRSELAFPKELYTSLSIYLLFALGLRGGVELSETHLHAIARPAMVTLLLGALTPVSAFFVLRRIGRFGVPDAAGIAAHYGSVSAVTFIAAQQFVAAAGQPAEGYTATLLTLLESPGIHVALALGAVGAAHATSLARSAPATGVIALGDSPAPLVEGGPSVMASLREIVTARTMVLLMGGLAIGYVTGAHGYEPVRPFFDSGFKGALTLFLLEMGLTAGARLQDLRKVGLFLVAFGVLMPIAHGALGVLLGHFAGMSPGGCTVLGAMAASASYIAAPSAVRTNLPDANPTYSLTAALVITFPFNLLIGIPLYFELARRIA